MCARHAGAAVSSFDRWLKRGELLSDRAKNGGVFLSPDSYTWRKSARIFISELERELEARNGTLTKEHKAALKLWDEFQLSTDMVVQECLQTIDRAKNIDPLWAEKTLNKLHPEEIESPNYLEDNLADSAEREPTSLRADQIGSAYANVYRDILQHSHSEYVFKGGRGSLKSSFSSEMVIMLIENNPRVHALAVRKVGATLRDSVFSQLKWAIAEFGHEERWKQTTSPLEMTYLPTGQKIYFRGVDDPLKIKSIKPEFGAISILWFEELDQFAGANEVRNIEQSAIRGTDSAYIFKSFNPPQSKLNWANKYVEMPKPGRFVHTSDYRQAPSEWLGEVFIREAEFLREVNPIAYEHEYLGIPNSAGGLVFPNVELREIADEDIAGFEYVYQGIDWGFAVDPVDWGRCAYEAKKRTLYLFDEFRAVGMSNRELYEVLTQQKSVQPGDMIIADRAEPKSIADLVAYGLNVRGAEIGPDSVRYSIKWLQTLRLVIDPVRCPHTAREFTEYEYEKTKDGEIISQYPDKNNHSIDRTRYATNYIWRKWGQ